LRWAVLDTNVYVDFWQRGLHAQAVQAVHAAFVIRHSAVVLSELRRGARTQQARRTVEGLYRLATEVWEPTADDWWEAGKLVREIGDQSTWDIHKRREFQNDALLALSVRRHGGLLVTSNRSDFQLLERRLGLRVQYL
jgi:predicted nucleic acid-binding protein